MTHITDESKRYWVCDDYARDVTHGCPADIEFGTYGVYVLASALDAARAEVARLHRQLDEAEATRSGEAFEGALADELHKTRVATLTAALEEANVEREKLTTWLRQTQQDAGDDARRLIDEKMAAMAECEAMRANDARLTAIGKIIASRRASKITTDLYYYTQQYVAAIEAAYDAALTQEKRGG